MRPVAWTSETLRQQLLLDTTPVTSAESLLHHTNDPNLVSFLDNLAIESLERTARERGTTAGQLDFPGHAIAICDGSLQRAIDWLQALPWLSHVIGQSLLAQPMASSHLTNVVASLASADRPPLLDWVRPTLVGRRVQLVQASARFDRLEKMAEFFHASGVDETTVQHVSEATEELLTNAFYAAPLAAGATKYALSKSQDVSLPEQNPCDMVYGCSEGVAIVRVRDPFGALTRSSVVDALGRCAREDSPLEIGASGAGLGLWRVLTVASFVAINVVDHHHTDVLIGFTKPIDGGKRPFACHFFFKEGAQRRSWRLVEDSSGEPSFVTAATKVDGP